MSYSQKLRSTRDRLAARIGPVDDLRRRTYEVLELARGEDRLSNLVDGGLIVLILVTTAAFVLETVPSIEARYGFAFSIFEVFAIAIFTIEFLARVWSCVEEPFLKRHTPLKARLTFMGRPYLVIDLMAILPFYLSFIVPIDLRLLRVLRLLRFLKLARYSPAMHTLTRVLVNERRTLSGALLLVMTALLFAATGMYFLEHEAQPDRFGSIPESAWWAIVTLTTVGYGDATPITPLGKVFAGFVMLCGLVVLALPIAIIATGFSQEVSRRDFVLTWSMMSRIPLFADLDAKAVTEIMRYLNAHNYPARFEIATAGEPANAMYFIAGGSVRTEHAGKDLVLGTGDVFCDLEMIENMSVPATFSAQAKARLLKLSREDFQRLHGSHPEVYRRIREAAERKRPVTTATSEAKDADKT